MTPNDVTQVYLEAKSPKPNAVLRLADSDQAKSPNPRLGAVRRLAYEAAEYGLLSPDSAAGIRRFKGVPSHNTEHERNQRQNLSRWFRSKPKTCPCAPLLGGFTDLLGSRRKRLA